MAMVTLRHKSGSGFIEFDTLAERLGRMRRRVSEWCKLAQSFNSSHYVAMITLTYGKARWKPNHLRDFMNKFRASAYRRGKKGKIVKSREAFVGYAWVAELMPESGKVHYHILVILKRGYRLPMPDKSFWKYGSSKIEKARTVWYIAKYLQKGSHLWDDRSHYAGTHGGNAFPPNLRLYAVVMYKHASLNPLSYFRLRATAWARKVRDEALRLLVESIEVAEFYAADAYDYVVKRQSGGWYLDFLAGSLFMPAEYEYVLD